MGMISQAGVCTQPVDACFKSGRIAIHTYAILTGSDHARSREDSCDEKVGCVGKCAKLRRCGCSVFWCPVLACFGRCSGCPSCHKWRKSFCSCESGSREGNSPLEGSLRQASVEL